MEPDEVEVRWTTRNEDGRAVFHRGRVTGDWTDAVGRYVRVQEGSHVKPVVFVGQGQPGSLQVAMLRWS